MARDGIVVEEKLHEATLKFTTPAPPPSHKHENEQERHSKTMSRTKSVVRRVQTQQQLVAKCSSVELRRKEVRADIVQGITQTSPVAWCGVYRADLKVLF